MVPLSRIALASPIGVGVRNAQDCGSREIAAALRGAQPVQHTAPGGPRQTCRAHLTSGDLWESPLPAADQASRRLTADHVCEWLARIQDDDLDAAILLTASSAVVRRFGARLPVADSSDAIRRHAVADQKTLNRLSAQLREL